MQTTFYNDEQLHQEFVKTCREEGISISEALRLLMEKANKNPKLIKK